MLSYSEIKLVWDAASEHPFGTILKLLILTGQRWGEIASLRWDYIDEKARTITLPDTKNGTEHCFPYGQMVADILDNIPRLNSTSLLFPGRIHDTPWNGAGKRPYFSKSLHVMQSVYCGVLSALERCAKDAKHLGKDELRRRVLAQAVAGRAANDRIYRIDVQADIGRTIRPQAA